MSPDELLALSDERDIWMQRMLDAERVAYREGYRAGQRAGYERGTRQMEAEWPAVVAPLASIARGKPTHAELDVLRYGPGGRERFSDPLPSDRPALRVIRGGAA